MTRVVRAGCSLLTLVGVLSHAQSPAPMLPTSLSSGPAPLASSVSLAYQDRLIEGLSQASDDGAQDAPFDRSGWPRFLRLETRFGTRPFDDSRRTLSGYGLYGMLETPNHGALSFDGSFTPGESDHRLTLRQRELPLPAGWVGHHELGVIGAPAHALMQQLGRVQVPSTHLLGLRGEWEHPGRGVAFLAASGEPGQLVSLPVGGFRGLGGRREVLGALWRIGAVSDGPLHPSSATVPSNQVDNSIAEWTAAVQHERASDLTSSDLATASDASASATLLSLRRQSGRLRAQTQFMGSRDSGNGAQGFWMDVDGDEGPRRHGLSLYRLEPGLSWAGQTMPGDLQGASFRTEWRTRQWSVEGSYDSLRSLSGRTASGSYASGSARWRLNRSDSVTLGGAMRRFDGNAWTSYLDGRWLNGWGSTGLRLQLGGGNGVEGARRELGYDQEWLAPAGWRVSTSLGLGHQSAGSAGSDGEVAGRFWTATLAVSAPLGHAATLRGHLGTERARNGQSRVNVNMGGQWRLSPRWSLDGHYTRAIGQRRVITSLDPLAPVVDNAEKTSDRSFQAVLRYDFSAGSRSVPLGGRPSEGGGRIEGTVFLDVNRSGVQEASEPGAADVSVTLDNRYTVRTDAQGRFSFPFVASGQRFVTVRNETLPLPWRVVDDGRVAVIIRLRETTELSLPVQRAD